MLTTKYIENFNCENPLNEYPRPQLVRDSYISLNGQWDFLISKDNNLPTNYYSKITVPYCVESYLSGINKNIEDDDYLYYRKIITFDKKFIKDKVLLHFDAVDQIANVYINKKHVCENKNGYLPFQIDIKQFLVDGQNEIVVQVKDQLSHDYPYGKQRKNRGGMWYTPVSGIWQSVWIESVNEDYVKKLTITPHIDDNKVNISIDTISDKVEITILDNKKVIYNEKSTCHTFNVTIENPILWSPENPHLYDLIIKTKNDEVKSYFAMRKISFDDKNILLNNKPYFIHGLLDQGYFPDGIYTPASYKAYEDDILTMKELGFNCLRKHIKIEPLMFYYFCDKYGMLVFQDMVNLGDYSFFIDTALPTIGFKKLPIKIKKVTQIQKENFLKSLKETLDYLYNIPSIVYYTIFNEGWGQHDANRYYNIAKSIDNTRIFDSTSGWFNDSESDVTSHHIYFKKIKLKVSNKPIIVSEFGGYALKIENHVFNEKDEYGYKKFNNIEEFNNAIFELYKNDVIDNIKNNLIGTIYTQVSDVEDEINGLFTYDRKILKVNKDNMLKIKKMIDKEFYND